MFAKIIENGCQIYASSKQASKQKNLLTSATKRNHLNLEVYIFSKSDSNLFIMSYKFPSERAEIVHLKLNFVYSFVVYYRKLSYNNTGGFGSVGKRNRWTHLRIDLNKTANKNLSINCQRFVVVVVVEKEIKIYYKCSCSVLCITFARHIVPFPSI